MLCVYTNGIAWHTSSVPCVSVHDMSHSLDQCHLGAAHPQPTLTTRQPVRCRASIAPALPTVTPGVEKRIACLAARMTPACLTTAKISPLRRTARRLVWCPASAILYCSVCRKRTQVHQLGGGVLLADAMAFFLHGIFSNFCFSCCWS